MLLKSIDLQTELDLAFVQGNWRGLRARTERALAADVCAEGNFMPTVADVIGLAEELLQQTRQILACDPLRSLSWFNVARATLWTGDAEEAVRIAREGLEVAPGTWLETIYVQSLIEAGRFEEAQTVIDTVMRDAWLAQLMRSLLAAKQGDRAAFQRALAGFDDNFENEFMALSVYAWGGMREDANRLAARYDEHRWGPWVLWQTTHWCACGNVFDLEATPNFAAMLERNEVPWPPVSTEYPLKDW